MFLNDKIKLNSRLDKMCMDENSYVLIIFYTGRYRPLQETNVSLLLIPIAPYTVNFTTIIALKQIYLNILYIFGFYKTTYIYPFRSKRVTITSSEHTVHKVNYPQLAQLVGCNREIFSVSNHRKFILPNEWLVDITYNVFQPIRRQEAEINIVLDDCVYRQKH